MVIGNGFFSDTKEDALKEMEQRAGCKVKLTPFPTIGNMAIYVSENGDLYGQQRIQGKCLTRQRKHVKYSPGFKARLSTAPHKEVNIYVQVLIYCAFVLNRWEPDIELEAINGNVYDVRPENFRPKQKPIPPEWAERMKARAKVYDSNFANVCWSVNYLTGYDIQTCKDFAQQAFIYLCTDGFKRIQHKTDIVGLWVKIARFRAIDYMHHVTHRQVYDAIDYMGNRDKPYEFDLFSVLPGEKQRIYTRLYFEGNTPTEIGQMYGVKASTIGSIVTRSVQYLRNYYRNE
jgi:DNA-directed RNA polymerase specialized sigma24 family protein